MLRVGLKGSYLIMTCRLIGRPIILSTINNTGFQRLICFGKFLDIIRALKNISEWLPVLLNFQLLYPADPV
jgi:hypothetical protein